MKKRKKEQLRILKKIYTELTGKRDLFVVYGSAFGKKMFHVSCFAYQKAIQNALFRNCRKLIKPDIEKAVTDNIPELDIEIESLNDAVMEIDEIKKEILKMERELEKLQSVLYDERPGKRREKPLKAAEKGLSEAKKLLTKDHQELKDYELFVKKKINSIFTHIQNHLEEGNAFPECLKNVATDVKLPEKIEVSEDSFMSQVIKKIKGASAGVLSYFKNEELEDFITTLNYSKEEVEDQDKEGASERKSIPVIILDHDV